MRHGRDKSKTNFGRWPNIVVLFLSQKQAPVEVSEPTNLDGLDIKDFYPGSQQRQRWQPVAYRHCMADQARARRCSVFQP